MTTDLGYRLVDRPPDAVLFLRDATAISVETFLRHSYALAATLPADGHMINLCRDRYAFAIAFAASLLRCHPCLLTGDRSEAGLAALADAYGGSYIATDEASLDENFAAASTLRPIRKVGLNDLDTPGGNPAPNPVIPTDQLAAIVFTSGSTGAPTPHRKLWGALADRSRAAAEQFGLRATEPCVVVGTVPPQHMYGFETTVLLPLHAPVASWCGPGFYPVDVQAALAAATQPRLLVTTPLQLRGLLRGDTDLPPLQAIISATAALEAELAAAAETRWQTQVLEIFGATEVGSIASRRTVEGDRWTLYPGVGLDARDDAVVVTAPFAASIPLADEVERLGQDQFRLLGRRADIVKLGGHRASLSGLNRVLTGLPGVTDGVFLVPDDLDQRSNARLIALVVAPTRSADSILMELRGRLDALFVPRRVIRVPALPRDALGKLPREALLRLAAQESLSTAGEA